MMRTPLTSSSMRCAAQPAVRAMQKIGVYISVGMFSIW